MGDALPAWWCRYQLELRAAPGQAGAALALVRRACPAAALREQDGLHLSFSIPRQGMDLPGLFAAIEGGQGRAATAPVSIVPARLLLPVPGQPLPVLPLQLLRRLKEVAKPWVAMAGLSALSLLPVLFSSLDSLWCAVQWRVPDWHAAAYALTAQ